MFKRKIMLSILSFVLASSLFLGCNNVIQDLDSNTNSAPQTQARALPANVADGVILHAYLWSFSAIQTALPTIAAAGYKAIQVSPVQGTKGTGQWYLLYQPTNLAIGNAQLGTEAQFTSLCAAANSYGIKIIVDAVLNQVADNGSDGQFDAAVDSTIKSHYYDWFHNLGTITNYKDRYQMTQKNLGNGPDWNTQNSTVQSMMLGFLNKCIADGAGGFRFDAAKHIETNGGLDSGQSWSGGFWSTILGGLTNIGSLYLYGEVLPDEGDNDEQYQTYFDITTHGYLWTVANAIDSQNLTGVATITHYDHSVTPSKALVYAENHDTYEHGESSGFSYNKRLFSYAIMIARAGMTPLVLDRPGDDIWNDTNLVAVNQFRNAMVGQSEYLRFPSNPVLIIERGTQGAVIINVSSNSSTINSPTNLAAGTYSNKGTASATFTSTGSTLSGTIPGNSVVVIYNGSTPTIPVTPTGVSATAASSSQINLTWTASSGATSYTVYKSTSSTSGFTSAGTSSTNSFSATGLNANTTYYFYVTASNSAGTSGNSTTVNAKTNTPGTGLIVHLKNNSIINWSTFNCYYWASNGSPVSNTWPGAAMTSEGNNWYSYTIPSATSSNVIFNNGSTQTVDLSNTAEGWFVPTGTSSGKVIGTWYPTNPDDQTVPAAPTGVTATPASSSQINLTWTASTGAASYTVYKSTSSTSGFTSAGTTTSTSFSATGLAANTTYYFYVTASNSVGVSPASTTVNAKTNDNTTATTTIRVHYDVGLGNNITIRGSLSPLSWTTGAAATWTTGNIWVYTTTAIASGASFEYKALISDTRWSDGANYTGTGGSTLDITPTFNGNFYDVMDTISTNWAVTGGTTTGKWVQGSGVAQAAGASTETVLTLKTALNKQGTVTLAFKYSTTGLTSTEYLKVDVLKGTTWTQVASFTGTAAATNFAKDISAYGSSAMKIRFRAKMSSTAKIVTVDNVTISVK